MSIIIILYAKRQYRIWSIYNANINMTCSKVYPLLLHALFDDNWYELGPPICTAQPISGSNRFVFKRLRPLQSPPAADTLQGGTSAASS